MEFGRGICAILVMKNGKRQTNQDKIRTLGKRKPTNSWEYWNLTPSNKWR